LEDSGTVWGFLEFIGVFYFSVPGPCIVLDPAPCHHKNPDFSNRVGSKQVHPTCGVPWGVLGLLWPVFCVQKRTEHAPNMAVEQIEVGENREKKPKMDLPTAKILSVGITSGVEQVFVVVFLTCFECARAQRCNLSKQKYKKKNGNRKKNRN